MARRYYTLLTWRMLFTAVPSLPTKKLKRIVEELYTEEEARLAFCLPFYPRSARWIAAAARLPLDITEAMLEGMTVKGMVASLERKGKRTYILPPIFPGIFELTYFTGEDSPRTRRLALLYEDFFHSSWKKIYFPLETKAGYKAIRAIPVGAAVPDSSKKTSLDDARRLVELNEDFFVGACFCRHSKHLRGEGCDHSRETCVMIGAWASRLADKGILRRLSKEETLELIERCEAEGLLRLTDNVEGKAVFMCHCCKCCCKILGGVEHRLPPEVISPSNFVSTVDEKACTACGVCEAACPSGAMSVNKATARVDGARCLGCGLCVASCDEEALRLSPAGRAVDGVPQNTGQLATAIITSTTPFPRLLRRSLPFLWNGIERVIENIVRPGEPPKGK